MRMEDSGWNWCGLEREVSGVPEGEVGASSEECGTQSLS